jgi:hypothetical protein
MNNIYRFFKQSIFGLAGFFSDKGIFNKLQCSEQDFERTANQLGYEYFDCGDNFVLSKPQFCR